MNVQALDSTIAVANLASGKGDTEEDTKQAEIIPIVQNLLSRFAGPERKTASDSIIAIYEEGFQNRKAIINTLISGLQADKTAKYSYRINLYIARTIGSLPSGWAGTPDQRQQIAVQNDNFNDKTMRYWVDRALKNFTAE